MFVRRAVITTAGKSRRRPAPPNVTAAGAGGGSGAAGQEGDGVGASLAISLDAMGGDNAPEMVIRGADIARQRFPNAHFLFFGDEKRLKPMIDRLPGLAAVSSVRHAETEVKMEDKPSQALRAGRKSSMRLAIDAV